MKKILITTLAAVMLLSFSSCTDDTASSEESVGAESSAVSSTVESIDTAKFVEKVKGVMGQSDVISYPQNMIFSFIGVEDGTYGSYFLLEASDPTNSCETVAVFVANSASDAASIKTAFESYVSSLKSQFDNYNEDKYNMASNAVINASGNKVYMIVSPNVSAVKTVIEENISAYN